MILRKLAKWLLNGRNGSLGIETIQLGVQIVIQLKIGQSVKLTANPKLPDGTLAEIDGGFDWSADSSAVTVETDGGPEATITAVTPGSVAVSVTIDADLGQGVREIHSGVSIMVIQSQANSLDISIGAIVDPEPPIEIKKKPSIDEKG